MLDPREERAKFISLHELLFILTKAKGYSPQEAAQTLCINLAQNPEWRALNLQRFDPAAGVISTTNKEASAAQGRLALLARTGDSLTAAEREIDDIPF